MLFVPSGKPSRGDSMPSNRREFLTRAARALGSGALCTSTAAPKDLLANVAWPEELFGKATFARRSLGAAVDVQRAPEPSARAARVRNSRRLEGMLSPREGFPDGTKSISALAGFHARPLGRGLAHRVPGRTATVGPD